MLLSLHLFFKYACTYMLDMQAWVWQDEWFGLTMEDIRDMGRC